MGSGASRAVTGTSVPRLGGCRDLSFERYAFVVSGLGLTELCRRFPFRVVPGAPGPVVPGLLRGSSGRAGPGPR